MAKRTKASAPAPEVFAACREGRHDECRGLAWDPFRACNCECNH